MGFTPAERSYVEGGRGPIRIGDYFHIKILVGDDLNRKACIFSPNSIETILLAIGRRLFEVRRIILEYLRNR